jgi:F0F1-type ATP synthase membrane subunit c/vacuolar-type H+-ATPase subunit K
MNYKTLMIVKFLVCLGFGPLLLFLPEQLLALLGAPFGVGAAITAREYGAALVGNAFLTWFARDASSSSTRTAIIIYLFVYDAIALVAITILQVQSAMNSLGWGIVAVYLFFTFAFGFLLLKQRHSAAGI